MVDLTVFAPKGEVPQPKSVISDIYIPKEPIRNLINRAPRGFLSHSSNSTSGNTNSNTRDKNVNRVKVRKQFNKNSSGKVSNNNHRHNSRSRRRNVLRCNVSNDTEESALSANAGIVLLLKRKAIMHQPLGKITDGSLFDEVIYSLSFDRRRTALSQQLSEGDKIQKAIEYVQECKKEWFKGKAFDEAKQVEMNKEKNFMLDLEEYDKETVLLRKELDREIDKYFSCLLTRQENELKQFEASWQTGNKRKYFNKPSPQLLSIKEQLRTLITACQFKEAEHVRKHYDAIKQSELESSLMQMQDTYLIHKKTLTEKHEKEKYILERTADFKREQFESQRQKQRKNLENRKYKIKSDKRLLNDLDKIAARAELTRKQNRDFKRNPKNVPKIRIQPNELEIDPSTLDLPKVDFSSNKFIRVAHR